MSIQPFQSGLLCYFVEVLACEHGKLTWWFVLSHPNELNFNVV